MAAGGAPNTPPNGPPPSQNIQTRKAAVSFQTSQVPPSQYLYVQDGEQILLNVLSNTVGQQIKVTYRYLTPASEIKEGTFTTPPLIALNTLGINIPVAEGWLLSVTLQAKFFFNVGQWAYAQLLLARVPASPPIPYGLLWQGYVSINAATGWPGLAAKEPTDGAGTLVSITGSAPAAGAEINETVQAFQRWNLIAFRATLSTSVAVANRLPAFNLDDGVNVFFGIRTNVNQAASNNVSYEITPGNQFFNDGAGDQILPFPSPVPLKQGFRIRSQTSAIQAADQWSAPQYLVQTWANWDL